jgi:hypothetical protein
MPKAMQCGFTFFPIYFVNQFLWLKKLIFPYLEIAVPIPKESSVLHITFI